VEKGGNPGFSQSVTVPPCGAGRAFVAYRQAQAAARPSHPPSFDVLPDSCPERAESGYRLRVWHRPGDAHEPGSARRGGNPDSHRIPGRINARNAGGSAPSRPGRAESLRFRHRLALRASVGSPRANSYRILVGVYGRNAGAAAPSQANRPTDSRTRPCGFQYQPIRRPTPSSGATFRGCIAAFNGRQADGTSAAAAPDWESSFQAIVGWVGAQSRHRMRLPCFAPRTGVRSCVDPHVRQCCDPARAVARESIPGARVPPIPASGKTRRSRNRRRIGLARSASRPQRRKSPSWGKGNAVPREHLNAGLRPSWGSTNRLNDGDLLSGGCSKRTPLT
jgi:hypothetical protein